MTRKKLIAAVTAVVLSVSLGVVVYNLNSGSKPHCVSLMRSLFEPGRSMVMNNSDGGIFVLTGANGAVEFHGFVGPSTAKTLKSEMINQGLIRVHVDIDGTCMADSGLEYTLVSGEYSIRPQQQQPPQDPI